MRADRRAVPVGRARRCRRPRACPCTTRRGSLWLWRKALSDAYPSDARRASLVPAGGVTASVDRPVGDRLVAVHELDVATQHLAQRVAPVGRLGLVVDAVEGLGLPL